MDQQQKLHQSITYIRKLEQYIQNLKQHINRQGESPPGHYHSPIPSLEEVREYLTSHSLGETEVPDVALNKEGQFKVLESYQEFYNELPFPETKQQDLRYYYENGWYSYADAIFLYSFLRKNLPKRIIEIGSGFSSAVILDTVDNFFPSRPEITFVEPNPERLHSLLEVSDKGDTKLIDKRIQEVSPELFSSLESGDLLFIDSSHVVKCGSDLQRLMFDIMPLLPTGVFVHFHDVFFPFDYPPEWLEKGRYWNENYFLRAFLAYNSDWEIYFFNHYASLVFNEYITNKMPLCIRNPGGSLYIQRVKKGE